MIYASYSVFLRIHLGINSYNKCLTKWTKPTTCGIEFRYPAKVYNPRYINNTQYNNWYNRKHTPNGDDVWLKKVREQVVCDKQLHNKQLHNKTYWCNEMLPSIIPSNAAHMKYLLHRGNTWYNIKLFKMIRSCILIVVVMMVMLPYFSLGEAESFVESLVTMWRKLNL